MNTRLTHLTLLVLVLGLALTSAASAEIVGWWEFDKSSGTVAQDASRYGNDVYFNGTPQWVAGHTATAAWSLTDRATISIVGCTHRVWIS